MTNNTLPILAGVAVLLLGLAMAIRSVLSSPIRAADRWLKELAAGRQPTSSAQRDYQFSISFDSTGFTVCDLQSRSLDAVQMNWSEVKRVTAFKRDLFTVDCICIFLARADGTGIEIDEDMESWRAFCEALPHHLPGCTPFTEWIWAVATPAFATNETELYACTAVAAVYDRPRTGGSDEKEN